MVTVGYTKYDGQTINELYAIYAQHYCVTIDNLALKWLGGRHQLFRPAMNHKLNSKPPPPFMFGYLNDEYANCQWLGADVVDKPFP